MSINIDTRITPALHPQNVKEIDGYGEDTAPVLAPTESAFSAAYEGIRAVHEARDAAKRNPTWNEAQQIIHTDDLAQKQFARIAKEFDVVRGRLVQGIDHLQKELSAPVQSRAAAPIAAEIRAHVKAMPTGKLHPFLQEAIDANDHDTVTAILGAPSYLSGLTAEMQRTYLRFWHEKQSPDLARRLKAMIGARELIERNAPCFTRNWKRPSGHRLTRRRRFGKPRPVLKSTSSWAAIDRGLFRSEEPMSEIVQAAPRSARWTPGMKSPNPAGRPKGIVDRRQKLQNSFADDAPAIAKVVVEKALEGDMQAANIVLARCAPALKQQAERVQFELDPARPLADQAQQILVAISEGKVDAETGRTLIACIQSVASVRAVEELEGRIIMLEAKALAA